MLNRRGVLIAGVGLMASAFLPARVSHGTEGKKNELVLLTWPDYMDAEVIKSFEESTNLTVRQVLFESDQERDQQIVRKGSDAFDVMVVNRINLPLYARQGWLAPMEKSKMGNISHIESRWMADADHAGNMIGVPYFWGNIGLAYREDLVPNPPVSWLDFFRPDDHLRGSLNAMESDRELLGMALKAVGHSVNSEDPSHLVAAESLLLEQKPYVKSYRYIDLGKDSPLVTGVTGMAMVYNGDAVKLREYHPEIRYVHPKEGSALWVDYLAVGTVSPARRERALAFIDFLNTPAMAARNAQSLHFASPNREALHLASPEYLADPVIFPPEQILQRSEMIQPVAPRTLRRINEFVARLLR